MTKVTAIGCSLSCIVGAFAAVGESLYKSAISSAAIFSIAGELAASKSEGPGDFQVNFLNKLNNITEKDCCLLYTSPSPRDGLLSRMPSSA